MKSGWIVSSLCCVGLLASCNSVLGIKQLPARDGGPEASVHGSGGGAG
jgi:hypothetical protein